METVGNENIFMEGEHLLTLDTGGRAGEEAHGHAREVSSEGSLA